MDTVTSTIAIDRTRVTKELSLLKNYKTPWLIEKLKKNEEFNSLEEIEQAYEEFLKFVLLQKKSEKPIAMMSKRVDEVWHQFILFTKEYKDFCEVNLGFFLHHSPGIESNPVSKESEIRFFDLYNEYFGELNDIWQKSSTCDGAGTCADQSCGSDCRSCGGDGSGDCGSGGNDSGGPD